MPDKPNVKKTMDKMSEIDEHIQKRFDIRRRLGKGAYGIVWKAVDRKTKRVVAIKKIFDAFRNQIDSQRTFREIMFLQAFTEHPNVIKLFSIHRASNNRDIYLGFEYMETDLHNVIKKQHLLKDIHMRYIMYQLFKAMKYIHSGNVIHRDLKPSNILLNSACHCKIADFGLARSVSSPSDSPNSDPRLTDYVATRWYRAPEILIANTRYTKGIDMWSLGCIFGEMLATKPLFPGSSTVNQVEKILSMLPSPTTEDINSITSGFGSSLLKNTPGIPKKLIGDVLKDAPKDALDLISKLLILNPSRRLTAVECLNHLYVAKFHNPESEPSLKIDIIPPLSDNIQLSVDDYRNKLYELMTERSMSINKPPTPRNHHPVEIKSSSSSISRTPSPKIIQTSLTTSNLNGCQRTHSTSNQNHVGLTKSSSNLNRITKTKPIQVVISEQKIKDPKLIKNSQRLTSNSITKTYIKSCFIEKNRPITISAQQKVNTTSAPPPRNRYFANNNCEKVHGKIELINHGNNGSNHTSIMGCFGDNNSGSTKIIRTGSQSSIRLRKTNSNNHITNSTAQNHFITYNQNHGIISASALLDLKSTIR